MGRTYKHLSSEQKEEMYALSRQGVHPREICEKLKIHISTYYREMNRGVNPQTGKYDPAYSEEQYRIMLGNKGHEKFFSEHTEIAKQLADLILQGYSPGAALSLLQEKTDIKLPSKPTVYAAIDGGLIPGVTYETLNSKETKVYCDGLIRLPKWIQEELSITDGDIAILELQNNGVKITFKK